MGDKGAKSAEKSRKARFSLRKEHVPMSSDDDVPAPSPSAAVLARRASREAKSMREESGSEEDSDEPVEWEDDDEASSEEDGSEDEVRVSNAQRGRVRLHWASQSSTGLEVDDERRKSLGEKGWDASVTVAPRRRLRRPPFERRACASCRPQGGAAGGDERARP